MLIVGFGMTHEPVVFQKWNQRILASVSSELDRTDLLPLLAHFKAYHKRILYAGEANSTPELPDSSLFNYQTVPASIELAIEMEYRLELLASYHVKKGSRVADLLTSGFHIPLPMTFTRLQQRYIELLNKHPDYGNGITAKKLGVNPRTVKRESMKLFSQYGVHVASRLDFLHFGLVHYGVRFRAKSLSEAQKFDTWIRSELMHGKTLPFLLGYGWDVNQMDGCLFFLVPNQILRQQQLQHKLEELQNQYLATLETHEITGFYTNLSFNFYDHTSGKWQIASDLITEGTLKFIEEHGPQFPLLQGFDYTPYTHSFNQTDWLLTASLSEGLLTKRERQELVKKYGFSLADKTIWARENRLKKAKALFPYVTYSRLAFDDFLCIFLTCDNSTLELLHQLLSQHAMSHLSPTTKGAILFIGIPTGGASIMKQLTHTLLTIDSIRDITPLRLKREPPWVPHLRTHTLWNHKKTHWEEPKEQ